VNQKDVSEHRVQVNWEKTGAFDHTGFERRHELCFQADLALPAGGADNNFGADPEKMLAASLASCHMLTFLALAAKKRLVVASYEDEAVAELSRRDDGKFHVHRIRLVPKVVFEGDRQPDAAAIKKMHDKAHDHCFIANSLACEVVVTPS
jgi:organic hydroperoxide reductase OsmC/OhrA